jgi:predicted DsbA family dithiol-disulfide isomerase
MIDRTTLLCLACGLALSACAPESEDTKVLATIDGAEVTMADLDEVAGDRIAQLDFEYQSQRHQLVQAALDRVVRDRLLEDEAAARGLSLEEMIAAETFGAEVTEEEVVVWYRQNMAALGGRSLEELQPRIEEFLLNNKRDQILNSLAARLREGREVVILLEPLRIDFENAGSPAVGPAGAPVTLTEFSDFECPYCGRFFPTLQRLKETYGDRLRVVFRQYPLANHPNAFKAAEASLCAHDQGRFWELHDLMFTEQDRLDIESLKEKAERLGLDRARFDACLDSGQHAERIRVDLRAGDRAGVSGTPSLYINGIPVPGGAAPYESIAELIDEELERVLSR